MRLKSNFLIFIFHRTDKMPVVQTKKSKLRSSPKQNVVRAMAYIAKQAQFININSNFNSYCANDLSAPHTCRSLSIL